MCFEKNVEIFEDVYQNDELTVTRILYKPYEHNCYIVADKKTNECIVIDPGMQTGEVIEYVKGHNCNVRAGFLTHNHSDHSSGVSQLQTECHAPILIHEKQPETGKTSLGTDLGSAKYELVDENTVLKLGNIEFKVLCTPEHSSKGICLYSGIHLVFTGDVLFRESIGRTDLEGSDSDEMVNSLTKIFKLFDEEYVVFPGHGDETTIKYEVENNQFIQDVL